MNHLRTAMVITLLVAVVTRPLFARHEGEYLHQVSTELTTPCVPFAKPYARGKVKVLFLTPRTFCAREIVELWQRFDMDFEAVTFYHSRELGGTDVWENSVLGGTPEEKLKELRTKLEKEYDCIVLGNVALDAIPVECQYQILKKVSEGTGLLLAYNLGSRLQLFKKPLAEGRAAALAGVPWSGMDLLLTAEFQKGFGVKSVTELPDKLVTGYQFHKGRIVTLNWPGGGNTWYGGSGLTPREDWSTHWHANYDHYLSLVAKAILWTVPRKSPRIVWTSFPPDGTEISRAQLPAARWKVPLRTTQDTIAGKLQVVVRSHDNQQEFNESQRVSATAAGVETSISLPRLPCGGHYLDLAFVSTRGVEQWGSIFFRVTDSIGIVSLLADPECVERGKSINGKLTISPPATKGMRVRFELTDTFDRLIARRNIALIAGQTEATVSLDTRGVLSIAQTLSAALLNGNEIIERRSAFVFVPRRNTEEFPMTLWGAGGRSGLGMTVNRQYRSVGFNAILAHPTPDGLDERAQAIANLAPVPYSYRVMIDQANDGTAKDGWLQTIPDGTIANPILRQEAKKTVQERIANVIRYGPPYYTLGDENYFAYYTKFSQSDVAGFREYLKKEYRDLADLNDHWGTTSASWDDVQPIPDDQAIKEGKFSAVHDRKSYIETNYASYHEWLRDAIRSVDPAAKVGAEGSVPGDMEKTIANLEVWSPYMDRRGDVMLQNLAKPGLVRGMWWGGYVLWRQDRHDALVLWDQLLRGAANCNFFYCSQGSEGVMAPAMNWANCFNKMLPGFEEIRSGIGQTLAESQLADQGVYVHYSTANVHAASMCAPFGSCEAAQDVVFNLLDELRINYRYMTRKQIETGELSKRGVKLLILPGAQCLSDVETAEIRKFVEAGGTVIADVDVGTRDEHLKARAQGVLDDVFGVSRRGLKKPVETSLDVSADLPPASSVLCRLVCRKVLVDPSVTGQGALGKAANGQPVMFVRKLGRGTSLLLNFDLQNAVSTQPPDSRKNGAHLFGGMVALAKVRPAYSVATAEPLQARLLENRGVRYLAVWHLYPTKSGATVRLANPAYVYDVRQGKALGKTQVVTIADGTDWPRLYALLPAGDTALSMTAPATAKRGQMVTIKLALKGPTPEGRVIRVQIFGPDGKERECYRRYPRMPGATGSVEIPLALSDRTGKWTVRAVDVATGTRAECAVRVTR
ncbi:MAG: beta-galactosidase [Armatimonadetes bacterium]|nr:beta-galactosidase [Armatimonadota bacterium]